MHKTANGHKPLHLEEKKRVKSPALSGSHKQSPEQVIPLDQDEFNEF
jgi:hypothetical protein